jgi:hypothetical protein
MTFSLEKLYVCWDIRELSMQNDFLKCLIYILGSSFNFSRTDLLKKTSLSVE